MFSVVIGTTDPIDHSVFADSARWLQVTVEGEDIDPRTRLTSVAYSHRVSTVDGATGGTIDGDVEISGHLGIDAANDSAALYVNAGTPNQAGIYVRSTQNTPGVFVYHDGTGHGISIIKDGPDGEALSIIRSDNGRAVEISSAPGGGSEFFVIEGDGRVGIGTNTPEGKLHVYSNNGDEAIYAMSVSGGTGVAGYFQGGEKGVHGYVGAGSGYKFGVFGQTAGSDDLTGYGVYGVSNFGNGCIGVGGSASAGAGSSIGVAGRADGSGGTDHTGVDGYATDAESTNIGVKGSAIGAAVTNYGFKSEAFGPATTNYGIYASASGGTTNYAGYFDGDVHITGTLTGGGGGGGGWTDDGTVVRLDASTDEVGVGTATPNAKFHVEETVQTNAGLFTSSVGTDDSAVFTAEYLGGGSIDAIAVRGISRPNDFFGIGGRFEANYLGLEAIAYPGSTDPSYTYLGLVGKVDGGNARNFGVRTDAGNCDQATGIYGRAYHSSDFAIGVNGSVNVDSSATASGVMGTANTAGTYAYGVNGIALGTASTWNYGVYGEAHGSSTANIGGGGAAQGNSGWKRAVYGNASGTGDNYGVYGAATDAAGMTNFGVYGTADNGLYNWAGYFDGDVNITGTLYGGKSGMRIDHPEDPENQYLQHSNVVSPDMMNVYNGNVTTDASGRAAVTLPDYFDVLNKDFRYQLTVIGTFAQAIIEQEIKSNRFVIATDQPNVKVSWQVTGVRQDPYAEANRIQVEVDKPSHEQGKYQHPELYGFGAERGINRVEEVPENEQLEQIARNGERSKK